MKEGMMLKNRSIKISLIDYFGGKCVKCGYDDVSAPRVFEFHHRNPKEKSFTVGHKIGRYSWEELIEECEKCDLLCSICHGKAHDKKDLERINSRIRPCEFCGKEFLPEFKHKYCSVKCSVEGMKKERPSRSEIEEQIAKFRKLKSEGVVSKGTVGWTELAGKYDVAPTTVKNWALDYGITDFDTYTKIPDKDKERRNCLTCGKEIIVRSRKPGQKYCSKDCANEGWKVKLDVDPREFEKEIKSCSYRKLGKKYGVCPSVIKRTARDLGIDIPDRRKKKRSKEELDKIRGPRECKHCDITFDPGLEFDQKYCSNKCVGLAKSKDPGKEKLKEEIDSGAGYSAIGRKYGVSNTTIKKWAKKYDIYVNKRKKKD